MPVKYLTGFFYYLFLYFSIVMIKLKHKTSVLLIGLICLIQVDVLYAQNPRNPRIFAYNVKKSPTIGIKGGALLSTIQGDKAIDEFAKKISPQIGVTGALYFHPMLSIKAEILYESKGGKFVNHDMKMNLNYVSLPLYLKFNFTIDPEIYIYGGGYASYLLSANTKGTYEIKIGDDDINEPINEDISSYLNNFDVGVVSGLGVQGRFNRSIDLFLDFRYYHGFVNLDNGTAEYRYNFNFEQFWPEQNVDKPKNKGFILAGGIVIYLIPR